MHKNFHNFLSTIKNDLNDNQILGIGSFKIFDPRDRLINKSEICLKPENIKQVSSILKAANKFLR